MHTGTNRDAILYSVSENAAHGLRRTNEDKRRAVMTLLNDAEWAKWSDREIARRCGVSNDFTSRLRPSLSSNDSDKNPHRTFTTKHGTVTTMKTANIVARLNPDPSNLAALYATLSDGERPYYEHRLAA